MRLTQIRIQNFRSINDTGEIEDIKKIFALIGKNNAGKSTFLKAIQILFDKRKVEIKDFHKGTTSPVIITGILVKVTDEGSEEHTLSISFDHESLKPTYSVDGARVTAPTYKALLPELLSIDDIRNPGESVAEGQKQTLLNKILKLRDSDNDQVASRYRELSEELKQLKENEAETLSNKITAKFQNVINEDNYAITISPTVDIERGVTYHTGIRNTAIVSPHDVDIMNSGTGIQSMYILALLEVWAEMSQLDDEAILIIEEPEVYLHPEYQRRMFQAMRRIASSNQVIFTTHSPIMISDIWLTESVRQVRLNGNGETLIESVKIENVIDELGIRYEDVLNPRLVVFVEGEDDIPFFDFLGLTHTKIKIITSDSFRRIQYFAFIKIISSEHVTNDFVIITDSDGQDVEVRKQKICRDIISQFQTPPPGLAEKLDSQIFVLNKYEIESYFLTIPVLAASFPTIPREDIATFVEEYEAMYASKIAEVRSGTLTLSSIQKFIKPKNIFLSYYNERQETAYRQFWNENQTFLQVKQLIATECDSIGVEGGNWFNHVLQNMSSIDQELMNLKESILRKLT